jgi:hypothetical protein
MNLPGLLPRSGGPPQAKALREVTVRGRFMPSRPVVIWLAIVLALLVGIEGVASVAAIVQGRRHTPEPMVLVRLPGASAVFSRLARGTWDVDGPARRIDLANGHRYYLTDYPGGLVPPDGFSFHPTRPVVWPDRAWWVNQGSTAPTTVWAQTGAGRWYEYTLSGHR